MLHTSGLSRRGVFARRPLRIFPFDPALDRFAPALVVSIPYELVGPGPAGRLVEVIDLDGDGEYAPLDLDDAAVLLDQGLAPSESSRAFHQQMVYAVAMRVLHAAETSLGRAIVWRAGRPLAIVPHADQANAWYLPNEHAVFFGQARAQARRVRSTANLVGQDVWFCLSFEAVAHEIAHAVLWETGPWGGDTVQTVALQEGLADLVALLVRCTEPTLLARTIRECGLKLGEHPNLFTIGEQFGAAIDKGPVRRYPLPMPGPDAADPLADRVAGIGTGGSGPEWDPWSLGGQLASALLEAFAAVVEARYADLFRWSGTDPEAKWFHPDLVARLADGTAALAGDLVRSVIGALDYLPPGAPTIGDYVRAFVTADRAMAGADHDVLRACAIQACQIRGLVPTQVGSLAEDAISWPRADVDPSFRLPRAAEALHATAQALEHRRYWGIDREVADAIGARVQRTRTRDEPRWRADIERYVDEHRRALGWRGEDRIEVTSVTGAFATDGAGALQARVVVHVLRPDHEPSSPRRGPRRLGPWGATLIADSEGAVTHVISPAEPRRRTRPRRTGHDDEAHAARVAQLRASLAG